MSRIHRKIPSYCLHKASGQAVVRSDGKDFYLGPFGSPESHRRYQAVVAEWRARHAAERIDVPTASASAHEPRAFLTITELVARYREFAQHYYSFDGEPTKEFNCIKYALRPLRRLYGDHLAAEFGPVALKALRQHMMDQGLCRKLINNRINRVRRFFKWAVSEELIPASVYEALRTVDGLRFGRSTARESAPITPVADATVEATLPFVSPQVAAMIRLQRLTGMRPGEVVQMRPCDIDRSQDVWIYEPAQHKNRWRGHQRLVPLGPQAKDVLQPFLDRPADAFLFSPVEAESWRNEHRAIRRNPERKTKIYPSELRTRAARKARVRPPSNRPKRDHYDVESYRRAITYGIKMARRSQLEVAHWHPNQLRHTRGTEIRKQFGIEAAQVALGHSHAQVTEVYAERNFNRAVEIARELG